MFLFVLAIVLVPVIHIICEDMKAGYALVPSEVM
jgi:hypothetical protein